MVRIGSQFTGRERLVFDPAAGGYHHSLPPIVGDMERLQQALLLAPAPRVSAARRALWNLKWRVR